MKDHLSILKVRYAETDQMGVVHHGNYAQYLEIARIDWLEKIGISYKSMEKNGIMLPVYEMNFKFKKSAFFDDQLKIFTSLRQRPDVKIIFDYKIYNQEGELLTTANTVLVFMDAKTRRPIRCPDYVLEKL
ncbi:MAG: thioesterase [Zunongwangia sp.]|uniref:Thioesterase n=1 Tax=Zunongwangia profunda TaxID=398743 RepID=A0A3D5IWF7_9FLAO|nr:thioesterase family protein [Zunongwangia profunda]MAC66254.1 thioesterase [Flavobacteriaceae bacterium]MAG86755.1 thioesterase [Flavobacteriaceae bacterium]MAO38267.1 thioesterase [Zunongwangia sp.]HCV79572.1 thioesterase [Zunongwangia profunda]|tara:strand:+ start:16631 stop:17023 length:393 start_codon:yes stop_codon:yes gene_type:complete